MRNNAVGPCSSSASCSHAHFCADLEPSSDSARLAKSLLAFQDHTVSTASVFPWIARKKVFHLIAETNHQNLPEPPRQNRLKQSINPKISGPRITLSQLAS